MAAGVASGCAAEEDSSPKLLLLEDVQFTVYTSEKIDLSASDADDDELTFSFAIDPEVPTKTQGVGGQPRIDRISRSEARFSWTPGVADAGDGSKDYAVTFTVTDGRGGSDQRTIRVTVVNPGLGGGMTFTDPPGAGMVIDLDETSCVDELKVEVRAPNVAAADVTLELAPPAPEGALLSPPANAKTKSLNWCPKDSQLNETLSYPLTFRASRAGDDEVIHKRFTLRFKRGAAADCPGKAPIIEHTPPGAFSGPLDYTIDATIRDDSGFKEPPYVAYSEDPEAGSEGHAPKQIAEFRRPDPERDEWVAEVPNLSLADGEERTVYYAIIAKDDDDPDGTRCDHTTESDPFSFIARGGGAAAGQTYGFCHPCVADDQCGGPGDLCVPLRGEGFCMRSCADADCGSQDQQCLERESVNGQVAPQCVPVDLNCGQICVDDAFDAEARNDVPETPTRVEPGSYTLSICEADVDFFAVAIGAEQSLRVSARFDNSRGDIDLMMNLPGYDTFDYQSVNGDLDEERVEEPCVPNAGEALIAVFPYQNARNDYTLVVEVGPGECNIACQDDPLDAEPGGNDEPGNFTVVERFPYSREALQICREDADFYGFEATAGEILRAAILFSHRDGDLDMRLWRSTSDVPGEALGLVGESLSYRNAELIEAVAPENDIYIVQVFGATRSVSNTYDLVIEKGVAQGCETTRQCGPGTFCDGGICQQAGCQRINDCGASHVCTAAQEGLAPAAVGGECLAPCEDDGACRDGEACKRFDISSLCGATGANGPGARCDGYWDCAGERVCFPTPGGYCAAGSCDFFGCPDGTICADLVNGLRACVLACEADGDCRAGEGYACRALAGGRRGCLP